MNDTTQVPSLIVITGFPGTGKTRLGQELSSRLRMPFISKDGIKERIFDTLGASDKAWSRKVSAASHRIIDYVLEQQLRADQSLILESNFKPEIDNERFLAMQAQYPFRCIQILCWAEGDVLFNRFMARQNSPERHAGHVEEISPEQIRKDLAPGKSDVLSMADQNIEVDTTDFGSINYALIAQNVSHLLSEQVA